MGDIRCNLSRLLGERRITQRKLSEISGLSLYTINKLYNEKWEGVGRKTLVKLCETLGVQVGELFEYVNETDQKGLRKPLLTTGKQEDSTPKIG
ncbi:hypothetical protein HRbin37_02281 [bacterium HR37]|jgi:putative transcriptional regulator|nr:hypothetical protein HRbin37_02281 [bacterium HR37]